MKIAQVTATFPPYMAGIGNVCYHNSLELAKLGHEVTVYTSNYPNIEYKYPNIFQVKRLPSLFRFGNAPFLPGLMNIKDYDIVHLHYPFYFGSEMIYAISKLRKLKYIITYHHDVINTGLIGLFCKVNSSTLMKLIINSASKIGVTSLDYVQQSIIKDIINIKRKNDWVVEIPNGVDINLFNPSVDGTKIKKQHGIESKEVVLFVGALDKAHYFKGIEYLLRSFAKLKNNDANLLIVGNGTLKKLYIEIAKELNILDKTVFVGNVSNDDLPKYYAASDIIVLPSISMGEAFGVVLIEAMATGKPIIASNLPGVRTVISDGINGFLAEPKNVEDLASKIEYLLENEDVRREFGKQGRKKAERYYSWENIGKKLESIYLEVLSS